MSSLLEVCICSEKHNQETAWTWYCINRHTVFFGLITNHIGTATHKLQHFSSGKSIRTLTMSLFPCLSDTVCAGLICLTMLSAPSHIQGVYLAVLWGPSRWATWAGCQGLLQVPAEERERKQRQRHLSVSCLIALITLLSAACRCQCGSNLIR